MEYKVMSIRLPTGMHAELREAAYIRITSMGKIIQEAVRRELKRLKEEK